MTVPVRYACVAAILGAAIVACDGRKPMEKPVVVPADPYDVKAMDLAPKPSVLVTDPPTAYYPARGSATSILPAIDPLVDDPVKEVRLDVTNKVIDLAPGVRYSGWTFGDTIPGPVVRAKVGDRIRFTMTNRSAEEINGVNFGMPMPHSMDFHSAMVSPQDKYRSIMPGETLQFEFTANYPGVFMYHCGTPMILEHLAAGMYGMMVVEPKDGYPTKVDREYAVVQSEFYAQPDPQQRTYDGEPLFVLDSERMRDKRPTQVVFNGRFNGMLEKPLVAKPGERVRLFVLNAGPSGTSSYHVVGTIFDRAWLEGNPDNELRGMQTVVLGASGGLIVEFMIPESGKYVMVDHEFADASLGAIGAIDATGGASSAPDPHAAPPAGTPQKGATGYAAPAGSPGMGARIYAERCGMCHSPPAGMPRQGPDLAGVTSRRTDDWLARWIIDPAAMLASDAEAKKLAAQWNNVPMPPAGLNAAQVQDVIAFLKEKDATGGK